MENMKNESGRTMLEMLGVLGIMGIIMYGAVAGINYGMSTYKVNQVYNDVQEQVQGIVDLFSWSRNYQALDGEAGKRILCQNDIFSRECTSDYKISHPFGGQILVLGEDTNHDGDDDNFTLTYKGIPESACNRLLEMEWGRIKLRTDSCSGNTDMIWLPQ